MATPAAPTTSAQAWQSARTLRKKILQAIEATSRLPPGEQGDKDDLVTIDEDLASFRLACAATIFPDYKYAAEQKIESALWQTHVLVNNHYRSLLSRLRGSQHVVAHRKVEKLYSASLRISLRFYTGYFQRLWALCDLPELLRIGQLINVEQMHVTHGPETAEIQSQVLHSCQEALLHLGDLARYRGKLRQKTPISKLALTYCHLARDLEPSSGNPWHQLGIVYLDDDQHLDGIHCFYRSLIADAPHPNAAKNLETELKGRLGSNSSGSSPGTLDPIMALSYWYARLHAYFFRGQDFAQHNELEEEVLHRFELMLKQPNVLDVLLKILYIAIAAHYAAEQRAKDGSSTSAFRTQYFTMRLNIRILIVLTRSLASELPRHLTTETLSMRDHESRRPSVFADTVLPLARLAVAWLYACKNSVVQHEALLSPFVQDLYNLLAIALNRVGGHFVTEHQSAMSTANYLLPEDAEALGLKPLDDKAAPIATRLFYHPVSNARKPHIGDDGVFRQSRAEETHNRVCDLLSCGFSLVDDRGFPLTNNASRPDSVLIDIHYIQPDIAQNSSSAVLDQQANEFTLPQVPTHEMSRGEHTGSPTPDDQKRVGEVARQAPAPDPAKAQRQTQHTRPTQELFGAQRSSMDQREPQDHAEAEAVHDSEYDISEQVYDRIRNFLAPPPMKGESASGHSAIIARDHISSVHIDTDHDGLATIATPTGSSSMATPTKWLVDHAEATAYQLAGAGHQDGRTTSVSASDMGSPMRAQVAPEVLPSFSGQQSPLATWLPSMTPGSSSGLNSPWAQPSLLVTTEPKDWQVQYGQHVDMHSEMSQRTSPPRSWVSQDRQPRSMVSSTFVHKSRPGSTGSHIDMSSHGQTVNMPSSMSTHFQQASSSMPLVNSPQTLSTRQHSAQQALLTASSALRPVQQQQQPIARRRDNSILGNSAGRRPSVAGPSNIVCNGNVYDSTTAFGRGPIANKDDPTHFKNVVKQTALGNAVRHADNFDRAALLAALEEDKPKPKR